MNVVIDASVCLKWFLPFETNESNVTEAIALLRALDAGAVKAIQPPHWRSEVAAVIARLRPEFAAQAVGFLHRLPCDTDSELATLQRAVELAVALKAHVFDTHYHAVALLRGATLVTADERYFSIAQGRGAVMRLSGFVIA